MRAEAAERRLAALRREVESVTSDDDRKRTPDSEDDEAKSEPEDVPDPRIDPQDRKRQMELEMSETEKTDLRGGWEEIFPSMRVRTAQGPRKRGASRDVGDNDGPLTKRAKSYRSAFGDGLIKDERKRALGLSQPNASRHEQTLGSSRLLAKKERQPSIDQEAECWSCRICTFANVSDHGRCGRFIILFAGRQAKLQRCAGPDRMERFRTT